MPRELDFTKSKFAAPEEPVSATPIRDLIIREINDPAIRKAKRAKGRSLVPGGHNAGGATLAQYVCGPGRLLPKYRPGYATAQKLINALEKTGKVHRLPSPFVHDRGNIVVCMDGNHNGLTDHVGISNGVIDAGMMKYWMVDNQSDDPYLRNIGPGKRTPVLYVLRIDA